MFQVVVGHSNDPDSENAIAEVIQKCTTSLGGLIPQAGILFSAIDFEHTLILQHIQRIFPGIQLIGGTTNGEISSILEFQQDSLTLMLFATDEVEIYAGVGREASKNPALSAQQAIAQATAHTTSTPQLCLTFPDSLTSNGVLILEGLKQSLGGQIPIIGGMSADDYTFDKTYQFFQDEVLNDSIPVLIFYGKLLFSHGVASGWTPISQRSCVTKVDGNVVYEIDGQRALDFYQHYLGEERFTANYAIHALAVFEDQEHFYMRAPNGYDQESGSVTFFSDIPEQAIVQITDANRQDILLASEASLKNALVNYPGLEPTAALLISCAARRRILGTMASEEYKLVKTHLPPTLPCCGFYAYGEIAPLMTKGQTQFHNKTFVTLLMGTK
ncbi:FIST C-terminal domain-containing protein [Nostoc sp. FACHB-87]|uniref:FIST signal transduction protein n=1 Tax=Nostocales TaxID=1161 RepID=UPI001683BCDE|nr:MULTISPECIES: FIST N-terminal domain-containing protein [Nostocales]MBD2456882.1 FIST C-terminal domain-containing protein [Nostoc sp. FACHB-87]MBD2478108.1 FIST C-terminal domain-containing protein [Anabaena sp. FACHB-83]MBD2489966.1 FIST C-terminal domain-containing protein [Aulosira sp. FACHB-615]